MRPRAVPAMLLAACLASAAGAQQATAPTDAPGAPATATGNAWIDLRLRDMDRYAGRYPGAFADEIVRYLEAPRPLVDEVLAAGDVRPGDVYYACALARASGRSCRALLDAWRADADGGWEGVAGRLGLDPDAARHRRIREDIAASYRRWARPVDPGAGAGR